MLPEPCLWGHLWGYMHTCPACMRSHIMYLLFQFDSLFSYRTGQGIIHKGQGAAPAPACGQGCGHGRAGQQQRAYVHRITHKINEEARSLGTKRMLMDRGRHDPDCGTQGCWVLSIPPIHPTSASKKKSPSRANIPPPRLVSHQ